MAISETNQAGLGHNQYFLASTTNKGGFSMGGAEQCAHTNFDHVHNIANHVPLSP